MRERRYSRSLNPLNVPSCVSQPDINAHRCLACSCVARQLVELSLSGSDGTKDPDRVQRDALNPQHQLGSASCKWLKHAFGQRTYLESSLPNSLARDSR